MLRLFRLLQTALSSPYMEQFLAKKRPVLLMNSDIDEFVTMNLSVRSCHFSASQAFQTCTFKIPICIKASYLLCSLSSCAAKPAAAARPCKAFKNALDSNLHLVTSPMPVAFLLFYFQVRRFSTALQDYKGKRFVAVDSPGEDMEPEELEEEDSELSKETEQRPKLVGDQQAELSGFVKVSRRTAGTCLRPLLVVLCISYLYDIHYGHAYSNT